MNNSQSLIELLSDEYMLKILFATGSVPRSITQISKEHKIPITACYRRVEYLNREGLIRESARRTSSKGRRIKLYSSCVEKIDMIFENGQIIFEISMVDGEKIATRRDVLMDMELECEPPSIKEEVRRSILSGYVHFSN